MKKAKDKIVLNVDDYIDSTPGRGNYLDLVHYTQHRHINMTSL